MTDPTHAAYVKGRLAAQNGGSEADCPYPDYIAWRAEWH